MGRWEGDCERCLAHESSARALLQKFNECTILYEGSGSQRRALRSFLTPQSEQEPPPEVPQPPPSEPQPPPKELL